MSGVTSINGMTGDVVLDIPKIDGLATKQQLTQGLGTKQDKGDYALRSEIPNITNLATKTEVDAKQDKGDYALKEEIPDLTDYVKNTDYASTSGGAGLIKTSSAYGTQMVDAGFIRAGVDTLEPYKTRGVNFFIGKGTLENIKDDYVKRGLIENETELTADEKANVKAWLGYADSTDIMQAIASIPQFKLTIVSELPTTGEKMTLYFVPKTGTDTDVHDEYIWIEENNKYEYVGTTAVDLTDYVKNTDYAQGAVAGVVKTSAYYGVGTNAQGFLLASQKSLSDYDKGDNAMFVAKGTLTNVLTQYSKTVLTTEADYEALETKDANTLYLIEE